MDMKKLSHLGIALLCISHSLSALRISGKFNSSDFFHFVSKFGFQKTDVRNSERGFIFGNVSYESGGSAQVVTLAVLDRGYFLEYYGNKSLANKTKACQTMFQKVDTVAYDATCNQDGVQDFLRRVPCTKGGFCIEEDQPENVVNGYQFTYRIQDYLQSRFWYMSMVACVRNQNTCDWEPVKEDFELSYDIWLVNGNPDTANKNLLRYQYSCDNQDLLGLYLLLLLVFFFLSPIQLYAAFHQSHNITKVLAVGILLEFFSLLWISIHESLFALNGVGLPLLGQLGDLLQILSQSTFTLSILLLGMGWAITRQELQFKFIFCTLWILYTLVHFLLYFWGKYEVDVIENIDEFETLPGLILLAIRIVVMFGFLYALRDTMLHEFNEERLQFLLHFGAASLVWFIYLPILAFVALQISSLWRNKFLIGISYSVNTFAYMILVHSLWPSRSQQYFLLALQSDHSEELEELSEAPNQINRTQVKSSPSLSVELDAKAPDLLVPI